MKNKIKNIKIQWKKAGCTWPGFIVWLFSRTNVQVNRPHGEHPTGSLGRVIDDCLVNTINACSDIHSDTHAQGGGRADEEKE